jgi:hypothetical protein
MKWNKKEVSKFEQIQVNVHYKTRKQVEYKGKKTTINYDKRICGLIVSSGDDDIQFLPNNDDITRSILYSQIVNITPPEPDYYQTT